MTGGDERTNLYTCINVLQDQHFTTEEGYDLFHPKVHCRCTCTIRGENPGKLDRQNGG